MIAWTDAQLVVLSIGCMVLALVALRGERLRLGTGLRYGLMWGAIFFVVATIFGAVL